MARIIILTLTCLLLTEAIMANDVEKPCTIISTFDGTGKAEIKATANLSVCKSVKNTCCLDDDFAKIKLNYNGPLTDSGTTEADLTSNINKRLGYIDTILG
jgi:hypothetical protein